MAQRDVERMRGARQRPRVRRSVTLAAEVHREFGLQQETEPAVIGDLILLPPWRERLLDDALGPWYGPRTLSAYAREQAAYEQSRAGGGLWDEEEELRMHPDRPELEKRQAVRAAERYDAEPMRRYMARHSHEVPARELEVYAAFYVDGLSYGVTAARLGLERKTVANVVQLLRRRLREHMALRQR